MSACIVAIGGTLILCNILMLRFGCPAKVCGQLMTSIGWCTYTSLACVNGGHNAPAEMWHATIPVFAIILTSFRSGVLWSLASAVAITALYLIKLQGIELPNELTPTGREFLEFAGSLGLTCFIFALMFCFTRIEHTVEQRTNRALERAESANLAKSEFLANMSHEIRTPMTAILGFNDILLENLTEPENIDAARTVKENGEYLITLINDILDLSKIESGNIEIECIRFSPHDLVADVASLMGVRARAKNLPLEVRYDGPIPESIQSDPTRLRQILINLVGNAIKFTETGKVQIVTRLLLGSGEEPKLQFDVIDTGIGIASNSMEKIFEPFTQADGSMTRKFGGTGLGLTITKRLTQLLGGEVVVSSTFGMGSTFSITVCAGPLDGIRTTKNTAKSTAKSTVKSTVKSENTRAADGIGATLCNCRILLAEDGPDNQRLIGFILRKAGAEVTIAENGQIGFDLATAANADRCPFDVVLMDMQMPVLDGYEATRQLRNDGYFHPIIALTAHAMETDRKKCLDAGCDDYITKPVDRKKLVETVASYAKLAKVVAVAVPASSGV